LTLTDVKLALDSPKLNLKIHANEVVAITGLLGSGKSALAATLFGLGEPAAGEITLAGQPYAPKSPADAIKSGVFLCPKDRFSNGVISAFDIADNMVLPFSNRFSKWTFLQPKKIAKMVDQMISALGIVCQDWSDNILTLSGGNQQKVMVARWLAQPSNVIILDEPFQGIDIQARRDIGAFIRANSNGRATILLTGEIDEALEVADHIVVMHDRAIVGQHDNTDLDLSKLLSQYSGEMV
jgi:simple sugar transport system ATP-binding protein